MEVDDEGCLHYANHGTPEIPGENLHVNVSVVLVPVLKVCPSMWRIPGDADLELHRIRHPLGDGGFYPLYHGT